MPGVVRHPHLFFRLGLHVLGTLLEALTPIVVRAALLTVDLHRASTQHAMHTLVLAFGSITGLDVMLHNLRLRLRLPLSLQSRIKESPSATNLHNGPATPEGTRERGRPCNTSKKEREVERGQKQPERGGGGVRINSGGLTGTDTKRAKAGALWMIPREARRAQLEILDAIMVKWNRVDLMWTDVWGGGLLDLEYEIGRLGEVRKEYCTTAVCGIALR